MSGLNAMMAGQTINDRLLAARHSIAGQGLAKSVCKATTEEMIAPKKKHLDYLVHCTNEPNVSIPQLATLLVERTQNTNWVVVYKALITVHHLLAYGNERFTQYLASSNSSFQLSNFLDKSGVQGAAGARIGYDMSPFIRRYAKYMNEKALSYRTVAFDFCKVKRGKEEGSLRMMNAEKLLKTLPVLQAQLDGLLEFDCTANDLTNGVINMCFMLLFRDLIRLFACYNDGIINLLEKYFDMNKKNCREALDLYKKFLIRMDRVAEFLKVAENVGIDKGDIPDLTKAPSSLLDALEGHLAALEGKKGSAANTPTQTASAQKSVANVMGALSSTSSSFGSAAASTRLDRGEIDDKLRQHALDEEEAAMNLYKAQAQGSYKWMEDGDNASEYSADKYNETARYNAEKSYSADYTNNAAHYNNTADSLYNLDYPYNTENNNSLSYNYGQGQHLSANYTSTTNLYGTDYASPKHGSDYRSPKYGLDYPGSSQNTGYPSSGYGTVYPSPKSGTDYPSSKSSLNYPSPSYGSEYPSPKYSLDYPSPKAGSDYQSPKYDTEYASQKYSLDHPSSKFGAEYGSDYKSNNYGAKLSADYNKVQSPTNSANNPFLSSAPPQKQSIVELFGPAETTTTSTNKASDDLLGLGNPFADMFAAPGAPSWPQQSANGFTPAAPFPPTNNSFVSDDNFSNVFDNSHTDAAGANPFMGMCDPTQPISASPARPPPPAAAVTVPRSAFDDLEDVMRMSLGGSPAKSQPITTQPTMGMQQPMFGSPARQPMAMQMGGQQPQQQQPGKVLTGDLDSSLASLANNLTINKTASAQKPMQWNSPKNGSKPAVAWSPQPIQATTGAGYRPMGHGMPPPPMAHTLPHTYHPPHYAMQQQPGMVMMMPGAASMVQPMRPITPQHTNNNFS